MESKISRVKHSGMGGTIIIKDQTASSGSSGLGGSGGSGGSGY